MFHPQSESCVPFFSFPSSGIYTPEVCFFPRLFCSSS